MIPATESMLPFTGLLEHPEAREFLKLWGGGRYAVLDDGHPFAIVAIRDHPEDARYCWGNAWVIPDKRGKWLNDEAKELITSFGLTSHKGILAATDNSRCGRFLRKAGFEIYCQREGVSYYSITREVH